MNIRKASCIGLLVLISSLTISTAQAKQGPGPGAQPATAMRRCSAFRPRRNPSANFNADAATDATWRQISRRRERKIRRLLRRRLLAHSVGFLVRRSSLSFIAKISAGPRHA